MRDRRVCEICPRLSECPKDSSPTPGPDDCEADLVAWLAAKKVEKYRPRGRKRGVR